LSSELPFFVKTVGPSHVTYRSRDIDR